VMSMLTWFVTSFVIEIEYPVIMTVVMCGVSYFASLPFTTPNKEAVVAAQVI